MSQINFPNNGLSARAYDSSFDDSTTSEVPDANVCESPLINQSVDIIAAELGGNPEAYLAAMIVKFAGQRSDALRETRVQIEKHINDMQAEQVERMHEQADEMRNGALLSAGLGIAGGACTIGAGSLGIDSADEVDAAGNATAEATKMTGRAKELEGLGKVFDGSATGVGGIYDKKAKDTEADATSSGNRAAATERQMDAVKDDLDSARELEKSALDFLDQANQTRAQTEQSVYIRG